MSLYQDGSNNLRISMANTGVGVLETESIATVNLNAWNFVAYAINEATGSNGLTFQVNSSQESQTSTYAGPSSNDPNDTITIGDSDDAQRPFQSGSRIGVVAAWSTRISDANLNLLYAKMAERYNF